MPRSLVPGVPLALLLLAGCALVQAEGRTRAIEAPIRLDRSAYVARHESGEGTYRRYGFDVVALYTNPTADTVFLATDYPGAAHPNYWVWLVPGGDWPGSVFNRISSGVGHDRQIAVAPGASRVDTLHLVGPTAFDGRTGEPFGQFEGTVRLVYIPQGCRGDGACRLASAVATSDPFEVRLE